MRYKQLLRALQITQGSREFYFGKSFWPLVKFWKHLAQNGVAKEWCAFFISYISSDAAVFLYFRISLPWLLWTHNFCFAQVLCQIVTSRLMHPCSSSYWSCWVLVHLGTTTCSSFYGRRDQLHPLKLLLGGTHGWGSVAVPPGDPCSCGPTTLSLAPTLGIAHLI